MPVNRSFDRDIYFMVGAKGMLWNSGTGYNVMGGNNMPSPGSRVSPNTNLITLHLQITLKKYFLKMVI